MARERGRGARLQDGVDGGVEVLTDARAQAAVRWVSHEGGVVQLSDAHVRLGQDHLDQVDGALEEGPLHIHLPQIRPLALHGMSAVKVETVCGDPVSFCGILASIIFSRRAC